VKPPPFDYTAPESVEEALDLLSGEADAKLLAGGQSLLPLLSLRLTHPEMLIDLRRVQGLDGIAESDDGVRVGAMATQHDAETSHLLAELCPLVNDALRHVAHPQIRSRGTVGGSVAHADPAAELPAAVVALDASAVVRGPTGERAIAAADLYRGALTSTIAADEILVALEFPAAPGGSGAACVEVARRSGDYAMCGGAAQVTVADGSFTEVRLAIFGLAGTPVRISNVEAALRDGEATAEAIASATSATTEGIELIADPRVSESYKRHLASVVARRALQRALERAE
jgi:carbon-monoxide dehydrogenase medium subunit